MKLKKVLLALLFLITIIYGCSHFNQESQDYYQSKKMRHGIVPLSNNVVKKLEAASVERGKIIYQKQCMSCHGVDADGKGALAPKNSKPANLRKLAMDVQNFEFFISVSQWQGDMPGWSEPINKMDREDLTSYIKSLVQIN